VRLSQRHRLDRQAQANRGAQLILKPHEVFSLQFCQLLIAMWSLEDMRYNVFPQARRSRDEMRQYRLAHRRAQTRRKSTRPGKPAGRPVWSTLLFPEKPLDAGTFGPAIDPVQLVHALILPVAGLPARLSNTP